MMGCRACHQVREFAGGHFGSYADLGVLCPVCEAAIDEEALLDWWNSLTPAEQIAQRWLEATARPGFTAPPGPPPRRRPPF